MEQTINDQEQLLQAWMAMVTCIRGNRILKNFSLNEMLICNLLFQRQSAGMAPVTATELCEETQLLKSQINHILGSMEKRGLIRRVRSREDRRRIGISLCEEALPLYREEHAHVMGVVGGVCRQMGEPQARELTVLLRQAVAAAAEIQNQKQTKEL